MIVSAVYLRLERVQGWIRRFSLALGSYTVATLALYLFIGLVLARTFFDISAWDHTWRLGLMLLLGSVLSAAVAQVTATKATA